MPIYAYRCDACGFAKDVLQKISDAPLSDCPECGKAEFKKQLTAAGFQLKGTGWYVTDFRNGSSSSAGPKTDSTPAAPAASTSSSSDATSSSASSASAPASDSKPAPAST